MPTSAARPPIRTKKPGLRKYGASAREYGWSRRRPESVRGSVTRRRGSGLEMATAAAASGDEWADRAWPSVGAPAAGRYSSSELVCEQREPEAPPRQIWL